jgi:hypothetical protein
LILEILKELQELPLMRVPKSLTTSFPESLATLR